MSIREAGILADSGIRALQQAGALKTERDFDADQIQPASLDLRLGTKAYRVRASFMPGPGTPLINKLVTLKLPGNDLSTGPWIKTILAI